MVRGVCFDVGGVLVGSPKPGLCRRIAALTEYSVNHLRNEFTEFLLTRDWSFETALREFATAIGMPAAALQEELMIHDTSMFYIYEDVFPVVRALYEDYQIATVSNANPWERLDLSESPVGTYIDVEINSYVVGVAKPDPDIFHIAATELDCDPDELLMVGDSAIDMHGANNVGWKTVYLHRGTNDVDKLTDDAVDVCLDDLSTLPDLLASDSI